MVTLCCCSCVSRSSVANAGRCVWNFVDVVSLVESLTAFFVEPVMASPVLVMLVTLLSATCCKKVLYEMVTVAGWPAENKKLLIRMLAANSTANVIQKRHERIGARVLGFFGGGPGGWRPGAGGGGFWAIS